MRENEKVEKSKSVEAVKRICGKIKNYSNKEVKKILSDKGLKRICANAIYGSNCLSKTPHQHIPAFTHQLFHTPKLFHEGVASTHLRIYA